jgi:hypothetical protein
LKDFKNATDIKIRQSINAAEGKLWINLLSIYQKNISLT